MSTVKAVAKLTVELYVDAENLRGAEKLLDAWLSAAEDDDRLHGYLIRSEDWVPETQVPQP